MLPHENEPFADAHINNIEQIQKEMKDILDTTPHVLNAEIPRETLELWISRLSDTRRGFHRYKVCFADEVKQKERLHEKALHCRLNHK